MVREAAPNRLIDPGAEEGGRGWTPEDGGEIVVGEREPGPAEQPEGEHVGADDLEREPRAFA